MVLPEKLSQPVGQQDYANTIRTPFGFVLSPMRNFLVRFMLEKLRLFQCQLASIATAINVVREASLSISENYV